MCDMTYSNVCHDTYICVYDLFICVTRFANSATVTVFTVYLHCVVVILGGSGTGIKTALPSLTIQQRQEAEQVYVCEREREKEKESAREREGARASESERASERQSERESKRGSGRVRESMCAQARVRETE